MCTGNDGNWLTTILAGEKLLSTEAYGDSWYSFQLLLAVKQPEVYHMQRNEVILFSAALRDSIQFLGQSLSKFEEIGVIIPHKKIVNQFEKMLCDLDQLIENNEIESSALPQILTPYSQS